MKDDPKKMSPEELEKLIHHELRALPTRRAPAGFEARFHSRLAARQGAATSNAESLEQLVHRELRALPVRRAPQTLEHRVLAALEQRQAIAWWHKSWSYWPTGVKAVFAAFATIFAGTAIASTYSLLAGVETATVAAQAGERLGLLLKLYHAGVWTFQFGAELFNRIPALWLYGGLAFVGLMYVTLFGLGAAAYRTLYRTN